MIELGCHLVADCCTSLVQDAVSSLGGPDWSKSDPSAEVARLNIESDMERVALDADMVSRDVSYDETSNEWVLKLDPLTHDADALSLLARPQDGDKS